MASFGIKRLTVDNWLEADFASTSFATVTPEGTIIPTTADAWIRLIVQPKLDISVPQDIRDLFEVARGAMAYGYLFYPLFTLAAEQLFRVAEAAVALKCKAMNGPKSHGDFRTRIDWLVTKAMITEEQRGAWHALRQLRNTASHPDEQTILTPGDTIGILHNVAARVNSLFAS